MTKFNYCPMCGEPVSHYDEWKIWLTKKYRMNQKNSLMFYARLIPDKQFRIWQMQPLPLLEIGDGFTTNHLILLCREICAVYAAPDV